MIGRSNMSGSKSGLQACVKDIQEEAMYLHCNAHNMNLAFQDAKVNICQDVLKTVNELSNIIREQAKIRTWFDSLCKPAGWNNLRSLCHTRWTM